MDNLLVTTYVNEKMSEMLGYTTDEILGKKFQFFIPAEELADNQLEFQKSMEGQSGSYERRLRVKDGEVKTFHVSAKPLIGEDSSFQGSFAMLTDVTRHKQTESALESQSTMLSILNDIISMANKADDLPQLLNTILLESLRLLDFDAGGIYLVDRSTRTANVIYSKNLPLEFLAEIGKISIDEKPYDEIFFQNKPVFVLDMQGHILTVNNAVLQRLAYSSEELTGTDVLMLHVPERRDEALMNIQGMIAGTIDSCPVPVLAKDGTLIEVETKVTHGWWNNQEVLIGVARDITLRKQAEEEIKQQAGLIRSLLDSIPDIIFFKDKEGIYLGCNPPFAEFVGKLREEIIGRTDYDLFNKEIADFFRGHDKLMLESGKPHQNEEWITYPNGRKILIDTHKTPYWGPDGTLVGVLGISRDITERKQTEENLLQLTDRLSLATRAGGVGVWDYDVVNNTLTRDDQMFSLYGITREQFGGAYEAWQVGVHPDDRHRGDEEIQMALSGEKEFDTEFRVLWPDGSTRNIRALALVQRDASGKPLRMIGTNWDITSQKFAEEALVLANRKLNLLTSITRHDINNQLTVQMAFLRIIEKKQPDANLNEYLVKVLTAAKRISAMIRFTSEYEEIGVHVPVWQEIRTLIDVASKQTTLGRVEVKNDLHIDAEFLADPLITKVFYNLMDNALRYGSNITTIRFSALESG